MRARSRRDGPLTGVLLTGLLFASLAFAQQVQLDIARPPDRNSLASEAHSALSGEKESLDARRRSIEGGIASFNSINSICNNVPKEETARVAACGARQNELIGEVRAYNGALADYHRRLSAASESQGQASAFMTEREEIDIGRAIARKLEGRLTFVTDPQVTTYVQGLLDRLARASTRPGIAYTVRICTNGCIVERNRKGEIVSHFENAASYAGGHIYINADYMRSLSNEAELAGVLAHEVGHIAARHQVQNAGDVLRATAVSLLWGGPVVGQFLRPVVFMKYKRDQEKEADRLALEMLYQVGIKPTGLITALEGLRRKPRRSAGALDALHEVFLPSHPAERERMQYLEPLLADPRFNQIRDIDSADFRAARNRLGSP